jgi:hypothetical protein
MPICTNLLTPTDEPSDCIHSSALCLLKTDQGPDVNRRVTRKTSGKTFDIMKTAKPIWADPLTQQAGWHIPPEVCDTCQLSSLGYRSAVPQPPVPSSPGLEGKGAPPACCLLFHSTPVLFHVCELLSLSPWAIKMSAARTPSMVGKHMKLTQVN